MLGQRRTTLAQHWTSGLFVTCIFFINRHIYRHLNLEIVLAIPALNGEKQKQTIQQGTG